jgi:ribosomal protein S18 acetylase RimI-like enzyme
VDDAMCVDQLFVSPEHEAEGIGRQLLEWAEGYAISERSKKLQVIVEAENRRALEFYRGRGFVEAGEDLLELRLPEATS